ncbi:hypothetical protein F441_09624 [Phytophthora nicotianae CJ01A1]|uniref:Phospholipase D-like domain-containing protein n=2 Tax=Phytophthora nicotianae TaxID=4792 RepID=W2Z9K8_PHYNI|nr:hypothetical protein F441_09624 [Phytophthora nicotianae CJ01A1]ETP43730.1 hypothetical protein F442_09596 [Phytophthora nicotianae P10297]
MHYKLLILTYKDDIFVSSGSANLTNAAWNHNDELLVQIMGPPGYVAQAMFAQLFGQSLKTDPDFALTPTEPTGFGSEPSDRRFAETLTHGNIWSSLSNALLLALLQHWDTSEKVVYSSIAPPFLSTTCAIRVGMPFTSP